MPVVSDDVVIPGSCDAVWDVLADFAAISRWAPNVDYSCLTTGQADGIGAVRRIQAGRNTVLERIVEWETGRRLTYRIDGLPPAITSVTNRWELQPAGPSTRVILTTTVETGSRPRQKLAGRVITRMLAGASQQMLVGLEQEVSRQGS